MCEEPDPMSNIVTNMRWSRGSETWRRPQHTTEEQDEQTMPPSMPKQQQDWATARVQLLMDSGTCGKKGGQHTDDVTARRVLARLVPPELLEQQLVSAFAQQTGLDRHWVSEAARQNLDQHACIEDRSTGMQQQIGILVACAYFKNKEGAYYEQTVYVMTDGKEQSAAITQAAVNQVVCYLLAEHDMDMRQLYMWSDGCAGQFKGAPAMRQHWGMAQRFSVPVWWSYGATAHFKGRHDSEGGVVKQWLRGEILADRVGKCNALGFVQHCNAYHKAAAAADPSKAHRARASVGHRWCLELSAQEKRDDKHWDDECLTLLCSFAPDSVKQLCTLGKKLSVKMLNEYCKAVGLCVPASTLRADLRYMVLQHLNEQAECD
ncbi:hypothetical protein QJQ45_012505 [Haematococcus lacustris]|nr:hypothetical protein QJQ45_012505 [Haematococcus lacustris]